MAFDDVEPMPGAASGSAYERLRNAALDGEWAPGAHLSEASLSQRLGVSRTPVREAVARLVSEGLLRRRSGGGVVVATATIDEVINDLLVLGALEGLCAQLVCERAGPRTLRGLADAVDRFAEAVDADDPPAFLYAWDELHSKFWEASDNAALKRMVGLVAHSEQRARHSTLLAPGRARECADDWQELLGTFRERDAGRAESVIRAHWQRTREVREEIETSLEKQRGQRKQQEPED
jgi:DNA-binding GntR family transcriptional regulator